MTLVFNRKDQDYLEWLDYKIESCAYFLNRQDAEINNMFSDDEYDRYVQIHESICQSSRYHAAERKYKRCLRSLEYYKRERLKTQERINNSLANLWITAWPTLAEAYHK